MATSARPVAPSKRRGEGQGRTAPQTFDMSKVSARGLSFGVPSSGSPGAASFWGRAWANTGFGSSALRVLLERLASEKGTVARAFGDAPVPREQYREAEAT